MRSAVAPAEFGPAAPRRAPGFRRWLDSDAARAVIAFGAALLLWQGVVMLPFTGLRFLPGPVDVLVAWSRLLFDPRYWASWQLTLQRVLLGFAVAQVVGLPLGLAMGWSRTFRDLAFPVFEVLRPIPPLGWVPLAILFWPTTELSVVSIIFLGAFFTIVLNVIAGVRLIDPDHIRAARSLGATRRDLFLRIVLPATAPSIITGMTVGMGITWDVVIAAEIIARGRGLGHMTWEAFIAGNIAVIVVGMASIAIAGVVSSALIRALVRRLLAWQT
jgi:NitT/TauT family transport system permease protein